MRTSCPRSWRRRAGSSRGRRARPRKRHWINSGKYWRATMTRSNGWVLLSRRPRHRKARQETPWRRPVRLFFATGGATLALLRYGVWRPTLRKSKRLRNHAPVKLSLHVYSVLYRIRWKLTVSVKPILQFSLHPPKSLIEGLTGRTSCINCNMTTPIFISFENVS
jgi:hypothetical protein